MTVRITDDQEDTPSGAASSVRLTGMPPFATITYTSLSPLRLVTKAVLLPSGDHAGTPFEAELLVRFVG
jgi:hypothetical protein